MNPEPFPRGQHRVENVGVDVERVGGDAQPAGQKLAAGIKQLRSFGLRRRRLLQLAVGDPLS